MTLFSDLYPSKFFLELNWPPINDWNVVVLNDWNWVHEVVFIGFLDWIWCPIKNSNSKRKSNELRLKEKKKEEMRTLIETSLCYVYIIWSWFFIDQIHCPYNHTNTSTNKILYLNFNLSLFSERKKIYQINRMFLFSTRLKLVFSFIFVFFF